MDAEGERPARVRFAMEAVRSAVSVPLPQAQQRLRVLAAASSVMAPLRPSLARQYSRDGMRAEQELIQRGVRPEVSIFDAGPVDCAAAAGLIAALPPTRAEAAESTLVGALAACPELLTEEQRYADRALEQHSIAPRALLALMDRAGLGSRWSQVKFSALFDSLPALEGERAEHEAPNLAAMYAHTAPAAAVDDAAQAGHKLLLWLAKVPDGGDRTVAVNVTTSAMRKVLGAQGYEELLASDVVARQVAESAGGEGEVSHPVEESASVLEAMQSAGEDRTEELAALPPSQRARESAAAGFASERTPELRRRYFDQSFSALDEMTRESLPVGDPSAVVQEVCEAAAQVDPVDALRRARGLADPAMQAIGMIAVARVVASR